jgi:hypothetical protein
MYFTKALSVAFLFVCLGLVTFGDQCVHVAGGVTTNIGVITPIRTLGTATGDLKGAIGVEIPSLPARWNHPLLGSPHFGSPKQATRLPLKPAQLTVVPVAPGLFAVVTYPVSIRGGTGRFKGASGKLNVIGEADFNTGHIGLRCNGEVCFEKEEAQARIWP